MLGTKKLSIIIVNNYYTKHTISITLISMLDRKQLLARGKRITHFDRF